MNVTFDLGRAIADWRRQLMAGGLDAPEVLDELESHLRDDVAEQLQSGLGMSQAFDSAVQRIGHSSMLSREFKNAETATERKVRLHQTVMNNKTIIGIGLVGLLCAIVGAYYYWVCMSIAMLFAYAQSDGSLNRQAWIWFATCCFGIALLLASMISFFIRRRSKQNRSAG